MANLKVGIIGMGFIGMAHLDALRRIGGVEVTALARGSERAKALAAAYGVPRVYETADELLRDPEIQVIHNCTPNHLHLEINEKIIRAGKHVFSEKPLARNAAESAKMVELLRQYPETVAGVNFCYRMNALVQDAKNRIAAGEIGRPYLIHGSYLQDFLLFDTDYSWRVEPEYAGISRCIGDIGSHWMDLAQTMAGSRITEVCANTVTALPTRKKPAAQTATFSANTAAEYEEIAVATEDYAGVLLKFANGAAGVFQCSEISAGRKNFIEIEVDGSRASYHWQQETSDHMWKGNRDRYNEEIIRDPNLMAPAARAYARLAAGHPEGWNDAFRNTLEAFYGWIRSERRPGEGAPDFATFEDGHYIMRLTEAILKSGRERRWVHIDEI